MKEFSLNLENIHILIKELIDIAKDGNIIFLLRGDLASGKTTLVKEYVRFFYPEEEVTSPTFSIQHQYGNIFHYDFYNHSLEKLLNLGLLEWVENNGIHFIEWGNESLEKILKANGYNICVIEICKLNNNRTYRINNG
ncbi:tRNA (adenosine(37)-N6)-threonylcarbamoyltransferase complex ATPase subunit type 1 TsaE [Helicobacter cappadocius]|uniref:tRNA threonylcarbamoyladenosine biosynthesis protein TsaE n=1 Tax=Helicobacter cappadocius TaxID=3063998 RepID=A0AA90PRD8_9HELI|nr:MULTISPECIES: tRNA (adenosine(37)-N6)-threonylcarbamoyltransferase complex ATPase subunit type 1 TsaE [unclassified Helicobacter]MDO7253618.1 tRNA (adenosine(37)-N6)-threonylcarbamoyltransferase complex ATPase subunit type 1 TsaE [Helicobacter sp. faydin-H75]MDP2539546.1 tRNA (adenosine(37)-N6)-threonylcarbamoyltransferase complex ATPase subunit type 1 TsaE [Helicobacter sp. faydin-H76]